MTGKQLRTAALAGTAALALILAGTALGATLQRNGGAVKAVRTVTANDLIYGVGYDWADMPAMSATVPIPSGQKGLLVITFSAQTKCYTGSSQSFSGHCRIQVLVDGNGPVAPGAVDFAGSVDAAGAGYGHETHSMQFVAGPLRAGTHTVKVQWSKMADANFQVMARTLTVLRSKA